MKRTVLVLADVHHNRLCYSRDRMCAHPRQCPIYYDGDGEIAVIHHHAPCSYHTRSDIQHGQSGYKGRAKILLQRSFDNGETWPVDHEVVIWDDSLPLEEKRAILSQADQHDVIRSGDRGQTWERVPTRVSPPAGMSYIHIDGAPMAKFPDGTQLVVATCGPSPATSTLRVYGTDDHGLSWNHIAEVDRDPTGQGRSTYGALLLLPSGRLQCYMLNIGGIRDAIQMNYSDDGGYSWSTPQPIVAWGQSTWGSLSREHVWSGARQGPRYRSPWPLRLKDGRIVVIFGRRRPPFGMGVLVSEDDGETWSAEAVLRADASDRDLDIRWPQS